MKVKGLYLLAWLAVAGALVSGAKVVSSPLRSVPVETEDASEVLEDTAVMTHEDSLVMLDSLRRIRCAEISEHATELYKNVKFMLFEGEIESVLYPAAFEANGAAVVALDSAYDEDQSARAVSILTELNPVILHGAVYWSGLGDNDRQSQYSQAYIDVQQRPEMADAKFERDNPLMPLIAYSAAYGATNKGDVEKAKKYFEIYLSTDDQAQRQNVIKYYGQACLSTGDYLRGLEALEMGAIRYPTDMQILMLALQTCLDGGLTDRMQPLLDKALLLDPNEEKLQNLQAQLCERNQDYQSALNIYQQLSDLHPNSLEIHRHIAQCYYNLGATHYNASIMDENEKVASRHRRQSNSYFVSAARELGHVLANTPSDMRYLRALAHSYAAIGEREKFEEVNTRIRAFGGDPVAFNSMPVLMANASGSGSNTFTAVKVPTYDEYARAYIEKHLGSWAQRGEFEKLEDYKARITGGDTESAYQALNARAEEEYLKLYSRQLVLSDLRLSNYDIDNEIYRIDTPYGTTIVKVPSEKHEAEAFKAAWETVQIRAPRFIIRDNKPALSRITYVVNGKKYTYNSDDDANYATPRVYVDINGILATVMGADGTGGGGAAGGDLTGVWKDSDIDVDIPVTGRRATNHFALLIANENYAKASDVFGALHDGSTFREYCVRTLGIPKNQVMLVNNATGNQVRDALATLIRRVKGAGPDSEVIVYYAGHGLPDDASKEAYLMPVDANPFVMSTLIPMKEIYSQLGAMPAASTSVFVDACFSGTDRDGEMLKEGRGVVLKTKPAAPEGDMFVLSAASAQETALPYKEKQHGLFTYFLLKKLQESKGNATLRQIADYVITNVRTTSDAVNGKVQNPTVSTSGKMTTEWERKRLKP